MRPGPLATIVVLVAGATHAAAEPLLTWARLAPVDQPGGAAAAPKPADQPLLADVTGPARPVGLAEMLALSVRQAPALAQARIDIEIAEAQIARARAWADWVILAELQGASRVQSGLIDRIDNVSLSASVARALSTGGSVGLAANGAWNRTVYPPTTPLETESVYTETVALTFTQPLLRGRGEAQVRAAERIATATRDANVVAQRAAAITEVRQVVLAYYDLVAAERDLEIRRASLGLAQERMKVTEAGIRGGGVAKAELIPVETAIATREEDVLGGELVVLDQSLALRRLVRLPIGPGELALSSTGELAIPAQSWDQPKLIDAALATSPEFARLRALEKGATIEIEVAENGVLPSLDLALSFGPTGRADGPITAAKNMVEFDQFTASGSLTFATTWSRTAARAEVRRARAQREKIRVNADDVRAQVVEAIARAVAQVQVAERRYAISVRAVKLAEENLQVEQARVALGKSRNVDVLQRQDELRAAQLRVTRAVIDWHRAATLIAALTGEILPQYGIEVP